MHHSWARSATWAKSWGYRKGGAGSQLMSLLQAESWREDSPDPGTWSGLAPSLGRIQDSRPVRTPSPCPALDPLEPAPHSSRAAPEMVLIRGLLPVVLLALFWGPSVAGAQGELCCFLPFPGSSSQRVLEQGHMSPRKPPDLSLPPFPPP